MCTPCLPLSKKPLAHHVNARQVGCTHQKMTRLYDKYGATPCSLCHQHPDTGWLYRCTQDTDGFLPQSDFSRDERPVKSGMSPSSSTGPDLSLAALEAISRRQGNHEQVSLLVHHNHARHSPAQDYTRPTTRSSTDQDSIFSSSIPESTTFSTTSTWTNTDEDLQAVYDWHELCKGLEAEGPRVLLAGQGRVENSPSACGFRICHACRPTYQDRAIQSIDDVLNNPQVPPQWELENRRVSDARVLRTIGLCSCR